MANQGANKGTYLDAQLLLAVEQAAAEANLTVSAWIHQAIEEKLKERGERLETHGY